MHQSINVAVSPIYISSKNELHKTRHFCKFRGLCPKQTSQIFIGGRISTRMVSKVIKYPKNDFLAGGGAMTLTPIDSRWKYIFE